MLPIRHQVDRFLAKQILSSKTATTPCGQLFYKSPADGNWSGLKNVHMKKQGAPSIQCQTIRGRPDLHFFKVDVDTESHIFAFFADSKTSPKGSSIELVVTDSTKLHKPLTASQKAAGQALVNYLNEFAATELHSAL